VTEFEDAVAGEAAGAAVPAPAGPAPAVPADAGGRSYAGVWALAWPAIAGNLLNSAVGLVDIKIVGVLGPSAIAAVTTGNRLFFVIQAVLIAVTAGTSALVARAWGAGDRVEAALVTRASLWLCAGLALAVSIPSVIFAETIAQTFRLDPEAVRFAATFIRWLSVFHVTFGVGFALSVALRAAGDTRTPLWAGAFANAVNIVLLYGLVQGRLGFPALGVKGAAIANGIAFASSTALLWALWAGGRLRIARAAGRALSRERLGRLLRIGYPAGLEQAVWQGGFVAFLWIVALYGTKPYAAYGIGVNLLSFSFVVGIGFSIAASTLVGQHLGAGDPDGAERRGWNAMALAIFVMIGLGAVIVGAARPLARFLVDDPEVVDLTVHFIYVLGSVQALMAIEFTLSGALRGAGDTRFPLITVTCGLFGARVALAALAAALGLSVQWVYSALIADYVVKTALLVWRFRSRRWVKAIA
jgi:putative MATE family efflux protein